LWASSPIFANADGSSPGAAMKGPLSSVNRVRGLLVHGISCEPLARVPASIDSI
jgi:hypothetical protein